jgi:ATPase subunit of ABC transporter with duplicated ATPase domains
MMVPSTFLYGILCLMLGNLLERHGLELDPMMIEHMENILLECTLEERRDALEPFLVDAGCEDIDGFLQELTVEGAEAVDEAAKQLSPGAALNSRTVVMSPEEKAVSHTSHPKAAIKPSQTEESVEEMVQQTENVQFAEEANDSDYQKMLKASTTMAIGKRTQAVRKAKKQSNITGAVEEQNPDVIEATSIQSRFHVDTVETLSNDIDMKTLNISIGGRPVLEDAELRLFSGVKYGLVGRNGVGKSTLFKAIGYKIITGFPKNIRVLYVEQLEGISPEKSVLEAVLEADSTSMRAKLEFEILTEAQETGNPTEIAKAIRKVELQRLEDELKEAIKIAKKRSGARGAAARVELLVQEVRVAETRNHINTAISKQEREDAPQKAMNMLEELHQVLDLFDFPSAESKVRKILIGLGFPESWICGPIGQLSGGWKIRVSLAQALFMEPDLLLLDEPTNHLDLPAILWLEKYLQSLDGVTTVIISHDRKFLNSTTEELIIFRNKKLTYFPGKYDEYIQNQEESLKNSEKVAAALDKKRAHIEKSIQEGLKQAKQKGDDKKLQMVASRKKKLEERFGVERSASGHRFKLNRDMVGYFLSNRSDVTIDRGDGPIRWSFPPPSKLRHDGSLVEVEQLSFHYTPGKPILSNITLNVQMGDRIGIVGANGDGKSTLIQLIVGKLHPVRGSVRLHPQVKIGYFSQSFVDEIASTQDSMTTLEYLKSKLPEETEKEIRGHFGAFGIGGDQMSIALNALSGGQAVRVATGLAVWNHPQLLILDEPSNHLDMDSVDAVIGALKDFEGAVILVSHDQHLIQEATNTVYLMRNRHLTLLEGGVNDYVSLLQKDRLL